MKTRRTILITLVSAVLIMAVSIPPVPAVTGGCQGVPGQTILTLNPNATGTKYSGTITVYYTLGTTNGDAEQLVDFFIRIGKDKTQYGFSGSTYAGIYDYAAQQAAIMDFIGSTVIPFFYPNSSPAYELKSATHGVTVNGGDLVFWTLDFVLAVH
jgi:hypothetical protein